MLDPHKPAIIIPAYNEEHSIATLLDVVYPGVLLGHYSVVVACNGCTDATAEIVRNKFPQVCCLEIQRAGKTHAINEAEKLGPGFPRIYVDADVSIDDISLLKLLDQCRERENGAEPTVVAPEGVMDMAHSSYLVRCYYAAWQKTRFCSEFGYGAGVYGLNRAARERFSLFPEIISDDGYVRAVFGYENIVVNRESQSRVVAPKGVWDLLKIKTRSKLGKLQLLQLPECHTPITHRSAVFTQRPSMLEFLVYYGVNALSYLTAWRYRHGNARYQWQRDESSREPV
ncbi:glycosyltransferase [Microbulbifer agarilyticus]|uniref:glycosyltransferase n=1 Tax=Microbulbifer agarilyticus TaxID=260552 RepID=UPI001C96A43F|nr:glycosyltransferase [Microbulbifer agarilyticus]MBY6191805.1 glycosyltransferase [Microbulbifer agarilyticus]